MKKIISVILMATLTTFVALGQSLKTETGINYGKNGNGLPTQRFEFVGKTITFRYDLKTDIKNQQMVPDVFGIIIPNIIGDSTWSLNGAIIKSGDWGTSDQTTFDLSFAKKFKKSKINLEIGRILSLESLPNDYIVFSYYSKRWSGELATLSKNTIADLSIRHNPYAWLGYNWQHGYLSSGISDKTYWVFGGTREYQEFGNFTFGSYNPGTGDFWWRSQFGLGQVNQKFFCREMYDIASSYLVVPAFFFKHFSPFLDKGTYNLKLDAMKSGTKTDYEACLGYHRLKWPGIGAGLKFSENKGVKKIAPTIEAYEPLTIGKFKANLEAKYDFVTDNFIGYVTLVLAL